MKRDLAKDKAMCEAATPGTWREFEVYLVNPDETYRAIATEHRTYVTGNFEGFEMSGYIMPHDARFIAESRQSLPYWIAKYEEMKSSLDSVQEFFDNLCVRSNEVTERLQARISELEAQVESYQRPMTVPREKRSFEPDIVDLEELEDLLLCQMSHERGKQA